MRNLNKKCLQMIPLYILLVVTSLVVGESNQQMPDFNVKPPTKVRRIQVRGMIGEVDVAKYYGKIRQSLVGYLNPSNKSTVDSQDLSRYKRQGQNNNGRLRVGDRCTYPKNVSNFANYKDESLWVHMAQEDSSGNIHNESCFPIKYLKEGELCYNIISKGQLEIGNWRNAGGPTKWSCDSKKHP